VVQKIFPKSKIKGEKKEQNEGNEEVDGKLEERKTN
jgi:hypothetical protein